MTTSELRLEELKLSLSGNLNTDVATRNLYSTDASLYQLLPAAVAVQSCVEDIQKLVEFANRNGIGLIPRTAGTSLAGQVVGDGIVVDVSRHFTKIVEINKHESWVRVQPGVIRDELNRELAKHGMYFAPETSTANRAMIGGMIGNNSCGANSIVHGDTRAHVIELTGVIGDGQLVTFGSVSPDQLKNMANDRSCQGNVYRCIQTILADPGNQTEIKNSFPDTNIRRRNTGYALDSLVDTVPYGGRREFNLCSLLTGSEGTLFFTTEAKLNCIAIPENESSVVCGHFDSIDEALQANILAMQFSPSRCELMDAHIIAGIRSNEANGAGIDFIEGNPQAVLMVEFRENGHSESATSLALKLKSKRLGLRCPILAGAAAKDAWISRKAALGGLQNLGNSKTAVTIIEDAAVKVQDLPNFVAEVNEFLAAEHQTECVVYGHAGAGELHLRPWLEMHQPEIEFKIRDIATRFAKIVKSYGGALSGEHGSGRSRSEFIEMMVGSQCYQWMRQVKTAFDPGDIFNPGKITEPVAMDLYLRPSLPKHTETTQFRFSEGGLYQAAARCSGSGDCRKIHLAGGAMCPSYHATLREHDSTRARANLLRQSLTAGAPASCVDDHHTREILELCLSCKACKSECPSNVDMARMKAEFLHQYQKKHGAPLRSRLLANFESWCERARRMGAVGRFASTHSMVSGVIKKLFGIHPNRSLPNIKKVSFRQWFAQHKASEKRSGQRRRVLLFCDEFTNQIDVDVGMDAVELLELLGYEVSLLNNLESGRSAISLGMLDTARKLADENVSRLYHHAASGSRIIGLEPSALLTLCDEYPDLVSTNLVNQAKTLASRAMMIEQFLCEEIENGSISEEQFSSQQLHIHYHGHCHQKAQGSILGTTTVSKALSLPRNCSVEEITAGCCGMAGFFGYDRNKFDLSQQIGELLLFPAIRKLSDSTIVAASGTSCRQQIKDATGVTAVHPVQILRKFVRTNLNTE